MRRQLLGIVLAAMAVPLLAFPVPMALLISWNAEHRAVAEATQRAIVLSATAGSLNDRSLPQTPVDGVTTTVYLPGGHILGVPVARTQAVEDGSRCTPSTRETEDGIEVVVPIDTPSGCGAVVRELIAEPALHRNRIQLVLLVLGSEVALLVAGLAIAEWLGRRPLDSMRRLAAAAGHMGDGDLTARAGTTSGPPEVRAVAAQLNRLATRVGHLLHEQRRRSADINQGLRGPLAALRRNIDALDDPEASQKLIADHHAVVTALDEVIRTCRAPSSDMHAVTDLGRTVTARAEFWSVLAEDSGRRIHIDVGSEPLPVRASQPSLDAAVDALLGNVFAHTPAGVSVWLKVRRQGDRATVLTVDDAGPGFDDLGSARLRRTGGASTGLGLEIARRTTEEGAGELRLGASPQGGARVELRFPTPSSID
ncbi:MAG TPA: ATP-binding protein [Pseudonocardia sp.]|jgi:signal transduction histidine kinase|nr:ATP-binding protein [Pseudonocardia sp.]